MDSIQSGKSKEREINGQFPLFGSTGAIGYTNNPEYSGAAILIARVGANAGSKYAVDGEYSVTDNTLILRLKDGCSYEFFSDLLEYKKLNKLTFGSGQPLVTGGLLKQLEVSYPEENEQQKVASFLSKIDQKISLLSKKHELLIQYKKGVMQKIFNREISFKDKDGKDFPEWITVRLEEIANFFRGGQLAKSHLDINGHRKCIHYGELFTIYSETILEVKSRTNISDGFIGKSGDIVMPSSDVTPDGLARASCLMIDNVILGGDMNIIRPNKNICSPMLSYLLNFDKKKVIELVSGTTVKHIYIKDIKNIQITIPNSVDEQSAISSFLIKLDKDIEIIKSKLELTKQYKQGLLQQMFI